MNKYFKIRYVLLAVILLTAGYIFLSLEQVFRYYHLDADQVFSTWGGTVHIPHKFGLFPDGTDSTLLFVTQYNQYALCFRLFNPYTSESKENHQPGFSLSSTIEPNFSVVFTDTQNRCAYYVATRNGGDYYLMKATGSVRSVLHVQSFFLFTHPAYKRLQDSVHIENGLTFYNYMIDRRTHDRILIESFRDGYRFRMSGNILDTLRAYYLIDDRPPHRYHWQLADSITAKTGAAFSPLSAAKIVYFFSAYRWWNDAFFGRRDFNEQLGFLPAGVWGLIDANDDGDKDLLINVYSVRYVNQILLTYDIKNDTVIWMREIAQHVPDAEIADIDNDGREEIIIRSYSPCNSPDYDYFTKWSETGTPLYAYWRILNADGSDKMIHNKKAAYRHPKSNFYSIQYIRIPENNEILLGVETNHDFSPKKLIRYDLKNNQYYETDIAYHSLAYLNREDSLIVLFNRDKQPDKNAYELSRLSLDRNYQIVSGTKRSFDVDLRCDFRPSLSMPKNPYYLFGEKYYISNYSIFDKDLNQVNEPVHVYAHSVWKGDHVFFTSMTENYPVFIHHQLYRSYRPKLWLLYLLAAELLIAGFYFFVRWRVIQPIEQQNKDYAIIYSVLGKIFFFQLKGTIAMYVHLAKKVFISENECVSLLKDLDRSYTPKKSFYALIFTIRSYELNPKHEQYIFHALTHRLKNLTHYFPLNLLENEIRNRGEENVYDEILQRMRKELQKIQHLSSDLLIIMRRPDTDNLTDALGILWQTLNGYFAHPLYMRIIYHTNAPASVRTTVNAEALEIVFHNLIENALYELPAAGDDSRLEIVAGMESSEILSIVFTNPFNPANPKKEVSTGYGLAIAEYLITKFSGDFKYTAERQIFKVTIRLPVIASAGSPNKERQSGSEIKESPTNE